MYIRVHASFPLSGALCVCVCVWWWGIYPGVEPWIVLFVIFDKPRYCFPQWLKPPILLEILSRFSSVAQSCPTLCDSINRSTPGLPVHHQLPEFTQTHVYRVYAIEPSHPLSSPSPPAPNPSQHQSLFQWVNSSHEVAKVLEFQL